MRNYDDQLKSLRAFSVLSMAIPLLVAIAFGVYRYTETKEEFAQQVDRSLRVAREQALKVLVISETLQDRVGDQVKGRDVEDLKADEAELHSMLVELAKGQEQIRAIWILGPDGKTIASSRALPVPAMDMGDRPYFQFHLAGPGMRHMSDPIVGRGSGDEIIDFSVGFPGPDGSLGGVINVGLATSYMRQFYSDLASNEPGLAVAMFNRDGAIYARWPTPAPGARRLGPNAPLLRAVASGADAGSLTGESSDGQERLISFRRVSDAYPLYVGAGMSLSALRLGIWKDFGVLLLLGFPPFAALWFAIRSATKRAKFAAEAARRLFQETASRRKAEEALVQAQKMEALGRVAGGIAHEFNNALMVIATNAHLLGRQIPAPNKRLDSIHRGVESATNLTRQLLSFTRRQALAPRPIDPNAALAAIAALIAPILGGRVKFDMNVATDLPRICVDEAELELALVNLTINARDAMPTGGVFSLTGRVESSIRSDLQAVVIEVDDDGAGISEENLPKVFEPFFTTKEVGSGTGLGLSQVRGFCERAGGSARVHSAPGKGTTVKMSFPALPEDHAGAKASNDGMHELPPGKSVLLVEDDDLVADALVPMLEGLGCATTRVDRAAKAMAWLDNNEGSADIVVSDVRMPGEMDGLGLARALREQRPHLPLLLITGYADGLSDIEKESFSVLPKPCSAESLSAAIARLVV